MNEVPGESLFANTGVSAIDESPTVIERSKSLGFQRAELRTSSGTRLRTEICDNEPGHSWDLTLVSTLWDRCSSWVPQELEESSTEGFDPHLRFDRYDVGQRCKRHKDGAAVRQPNLRSRLSCLFFLNDGFNGGETVF